MNQNLPPRATNWCDQSGSCIFCDDAMSEIYGFFQFFCVTLCWPDNFSFGHFPKCKLYNHNWISILGAGETEYLKSTPDFSK